MKQRALLALLTVCLLSLPALAIHVEVHPRFATVEVGGEVQFHAVAHQGMGQPPIPVDDWDWSVDPDSLGTISDSGLFVAATPGHGTIYAACVIEGITYTGEATIGVMGEPPPPPIIVIIHPQHTTVYVGEERQFHAEAREGPWSPPIPVDEWTWSLEPDSIGTLSDSGLFVATLPGHGTVYASCVIEGETYTGEAHVYVPGEPPPPRIMVVVRPRWATMYVGDQRQFRAEAYEGGCWTPPLPVDEWTWSLEPDSVGTLSDSGLFVALAQGEGHVYASCVIDSVTYTGEAMVFVLGDPPPPQIFVMVRPWMSVLEVGDQRQFHAMAREGWFHPIPVDEWTWSVEPDSLGTISDSGLFVAAMPGVGVVNASCVIEGETYTGHARVVVVGEIPGGTISGTIVDESGAPIEGACVRAFRGGWWHPHMTHTDDQGNYELSGLPPGTYIIGAWAFGYIGEYWDNQPNWHLADEIVCTGEGFTFDADFELAEHPGGPFMIAGTVRNRELAPLDGAYIFAKGADDQVYFAAADPDGNFELSVPTGEYQVWAESPEFDTQWYDHVPTAGQSVRVGAGLQSAISLIEFDLTPVASSEGDPTITTPTEYSLDAPYPNPFNPTTTLSYSLAARTSVQLRVYDVLGREVATLVNRTQDAGTYRVTFDARALASGNYFVILNAGDATITRQIVLIK